MIIQFLYFEGCPHWRTAFHLLTHCLQEEGIIAAVTRIEVSSQDQAKELHFLGSPTILIDGHDIELARHSDPPVFGCRVYRPGTEPPGIPDKEMIIEAIHRALVSGQEEQ